VWRDYKGYEIKTKSCQTVNGANFNVFEIYKDCKYITTQEKLKDAKHYIDNLEKSQEIS